MPKSPESRRFSEQTLTFSENIQLPSSNEFLNQLGSTINFKRKHTQSNTDTEQVKTHLGDIYASKKQWKNAIDFYQQALKEKPYSATVYGKLAYAYRQVKQDKNSYICLFRFYTLKPQKVTATKLVRLGNTLMKQDNFAEASICFRKALELEPEFVEAKEKFQQVSKALYHQQLANQEIIVKKLHSPSEESFSSISNTKTSNLEKIKQEEPNSDILIRGKSYYELGMDAERDEAWQLATAYYRKAIEIDPNAWKSSYYLGKVLSKQALWLEAIKAYSKSIIVNPGFLWSHYKLADAMVEIENWNGAIAAYREAFKIKPDLPEIAKKLNYALNNKFKSDRQQLSSFYQSAIDQEPESESLCYQILEVEPHNTKAYISLGQIKASQGENNLAIAFYKIALQIEPNDLEALTALEKLKSQSD